MKNYICKVGNAAVSLRILPGELFETVNFIAMQNDDPAHFLTCSMERIYFEELLDAIRIGYILTLKNRSGPKDVILWSSPLEEYLSKIKLCKQVILSTASDSFCTISLIVKKVKSQELVDQLTVTFTSYSELRRIMLECTRFLDLWYEVYGKKQVLEELNEMKCFPEKPSLSSLNTFPCMSETVRKEETVLESIFKAAGKIAPLENGYYTVMAYRKEDKEPLCIRFSQERVRMNRDFWNEFSKKIHRGISFSLGYVERDKENLEFDHFIK